MVLIKIGGRSGGGDRGEGLAVRYACDCTCEALLGKHVLLTVLKSHSDVVGTKGPSGWGVVHVVFVLIGMVAARASA
mgnify:CR=1 FL=1